MKKILSLALALSVFASIGSGLPAGVSAAGEEPAQAAIVVFDGALKNSFSISNWGESGTGTVVENGKLRVIMGSLNNEIKAGDTYYSGADWIADGALVMDVNMTTTLESGSEFRTQMDIFRSDGAGGYTQKNESDGYMMLYQDMLANGRVSIQEDNATYQRLSIPLDKASGGWTGGAEADLADEGRYFKSLKFRVGNPANAEHDTVLLDKVAFAHTSPTEVDSVSYFTESGEAVPVTDGQLGKSLGVKPGIIKIKVKNFGLVDDSTLDGISITNGGDTIAVATSFDMNTNTITLTVENPEEIEYDKQYYLVVGGVGVYGGNKVTDYYETFSVAEKTALAGYRMLDYAGKDLGSLITTDLETIELTFTNSAVDPETLNGFQIYSSLGLPVETEATKVDNKVNIVIKGNLTDESTYYLMATGVKDLSGEGIIFGDNITFSTQNTIVFFDDDVQNGFSLGTRSAPAEDTGFIQEITDEKSFNGNTSLHLLRPSLAEGAPTTQFKWVFENSDWTEYYEQNWSFTYWMTADSYDSTTIDGVPYKKIPFWHTFIIDDKWHPMPWGEISKDYNTWNGDSEWNYFAYPMSCLEEADTAVWDNVDQIAGAPNPDINVYFDDIKLVANTRIILNGITFKDAEGKVIAGVDNIAPETIEVAFTGNLNRNTVKDGVSITSENGEIEYDYIVDYENAVIKITPVTDFANDTEYTVTVDGLFGYGGAPQKNTLKATFTSAAEMPVQSGYTITYYNGGETVTDGMVDSITVDVNVDGWQEGEEYMMYLALYQDGCLTNVVSQAATVGEAVLTADFDDAINIDAFEVKAFVWDDMTPIL